MIDIKVGFVSLGCDKNRVDSEKMLFALKKAGYAFTSDEKEADVIIINTCAFIDSAKKEAIEAIFEAVHNKKDPSVKILVTGCFATRYGDVDFPEVDLFLPVKEEDKLVSILNGWFNSQNAPCFDEGRVLTTPPHYAYLKIADGCNNRCSYCAIPYIRGKYTSYPMEKLIEEAKKLVDDGVKELILVAQDTTCYGIDLYKKYALLDLLKELVKLDLWKIRILYVYPEKVTKELLDFIYSEEKMAKYVDIPLQHVNSELLKKMNRRTDGAKIRELVSLIRREYPKIAIRSSFIAGFSGESQEMHEELLDFIKENGVNYGGFFAYSREEGTPAYNFPETVPTRIAKKRVKDLEIAQCIATIKQNERYLGKTLEVIYEGIDYENDAFYGRTEYNAPDVDTKVIFTAQFPLQISNVYKVRIIKTDFHLYGEVVQ